MNTAFPLIAFVIACAALALSSGVPKSSRPGVVGPLLLIAALMGCGFFWRDQFANVFPAACAASAGIALSLLLRVMEGVREPSAAAAIGFAATISGIIQWVDPTYSDSVSLAVIVGLAFGGWLCGDMRIGFASLPVGTAVYASALIAANFMGAKAIETEAGALTGTLFGLAGAIAALIALVANRSEKAGASNLKATPGFIAIAILLNLGFIVGSRLVESREAWMIFDGAVVAAVVVHWMIRPEGRDDSFSFLLGSVIWIGAATLAFSFMKGFGMAIATSGAILALLILGNMRALLTVGPLLGLTLYRVLRESNLDAVRALDIGQHYAVLGLVFGVVAALMPSDWIMRRSAGSFRSSLGRLLWALALGAVPIAMAVVLGAKGIVGFVVGLGFASLIEGLRNGASMIPILFAGGLAAIVSVSYPWLHHLLDLTREEKQVAFYWIAGATLALGLLIAMVSKPDAALEPEVVS